MVTRMTLGTAKDRLAYAFPQHFGVFRVVDIVELSWIRSGDAHGGEP